MIDGRTFYQILGVLNTAEDLVIRASYRSLSQKYHPDKWTDDKSVAHKRMSEINAAYEALGDTTKRQRYDEELKKGGKYDEKPKNQEKKGPAGTDRLAAELALVRLKAELGEVDEALANAYASMPKDYDAVEIEALREQRSGELGLTFGEVAALVISLPSFVIFAAIIIFLVTNFQSAYWGRVIPWGLGSFVILVFSFRKFAARVPARMKAAKMRREKRVAAWSDGVSTLTFQRETILRQIEESRSLLA